MRWLALLPWILLGIQMPAAQAYDQQALMAAYASVVMVHGEQETGPQATGSGVVVATDSVLTSCQVLRNTQHPRISQGKQSFDVHSVRADTWHDLCLLTTERLPLRPVTRGNSHQLMRGQEITAIAHSREAPAPVTSVGEIQALYPAEAGQIIRNDAQFLLGASGSGLFDMEGKLIGFNITKVSGSGGSIQFALPVEWLDVLARLPDHQTFPVTGPALWQAAAAQQPYYLRAASPESRQAWQQMADISSEWAQQEANNADAWFSLGIAAQSLEQWALAARAYQAALSLDEQFIAAWFRRGELAYREGDSQMLETISQHLQQLDPLLVSSFHNYLQCEHNCRSQ